MYSILSRATMVFPLSASVKIICGFDEIFIGCHQRQNVGVNFCCVRFMFFISLISGKISLRNCFLICWGNLKVLFSIYFMYLIEIRLLLRTGRQKLFSTTKTSDFTWNIRIAHINESFISRFYI